MAKAQTVPMRQLNAGLIPVDEIEEVMQEIRKINVTLVDEGYDALPLKVWFPLAAKLWLKSQRSIYESAKAAKDEAERKRIVEAWAKEVAKILEKYSRGT